MVVQVNLDEPAATFNNSVEHFATDCMFLWTGTVFAIEKIVLHQFFVLEVAKMVDVVRSLSAGQHNIFFVFFFLLSMVSHDLLRSLFFVGCFIFDAFNFWDHEVSQNV